MTPKWPSSWSYAVSGFHFQLHSNHATRRIIQASHPSFRYLHTTQHKQQPQPPARFAKPTSPDEATTKAIQKDYSAKAALDAVESKSKTDPVNPPRSTLPPPLEIPEREHSQTVFIYWFRVGKAYGSFYKEGVKAVWYNNKAARLLRERIRLDLGAQDAVDAAAKGLITRSEWQLILRNNRDIGKLPLFGLLVLVFGEWLPLLVPFIPNAVPGTCRIPKQAQNMRAVAEERRRISFRKGVQEPSPEQVKDDQVVVARRPIGKAEWPLVDTTSVRTLLQSLRDDQLHHLSSTLSLHGRFWDRLQLPPPSFLLRRALVRRLQTMAIDDKLLLKHGGAAGLKSRELQSACDDRGIDTLGKKDDTLRQVLSKWLKQQEEGKGRGSAILRMLFRRPNAWDIK